MNSYLNSYELLNRYTPGGSQTLSKMACRYPEVYPKVVRSGSWGKLWDGGREYIDLISGLGAISVGYCHPYIDYCVESQLHNGVTFSLPTDMEWILAKRLCQLVPHTDMWKFGKTGTDGTVYAVRAARAYTGREKIMTVGYNGCADQFEIKGVRNAGIPKVLDSLITKAKYNDLHSFKDLLKGEYACVLMEPMVTEYPNPGFLESVADMCQATGTLLIFDEVVTGGRFRKFTASAEFNILPDLIVLSKGLANGFPLCAVGGKASVMATFGRDDFFASGTFGGETISLVAALATTNVLEKETERMFAKGIRIKDAFNKLPWKAKAEGYPTRLDFIFPTQGHKYLFWQEMCKQGVLLGYNNFIMAGHTDKDVTDIINAIFGAYKILKDNWNDPLKALIGPIPSAAVRK